MKVKVLRTIAYGGVLAVRCIGINMDYTMSISLLILKLLAADSTNIGVTYFGNKYVKFVQIAGTY